MRRLFLIAAVCTAVAGTADARSIEKLENIRAVARAFALEKVGGADDDIEIVVGALDPRLRLAACEEPLGAYFSPGTRTVGKTTVGVRCDGPQPWSLFVPMEIVRQIAVAVALTELPRGHVITAADVGYESRSLATLTSGYFARNNVPIGKITTRPIIRGSPITQNMVKARRLVRRGQRIVLALQTGSVAVRVAGTALRDGSRGESIPVRNMSSKRVIEGIVHEPGLVFVGRAPAKL